MSAPLLPFAGKLPSGHFAPPHSLSSPSGLNMVNLPELQRAQMMEFSQRLRAFGLPYSASGHPQLHNRLLQVDPLFYLYGRQDPRLGFFHEEPKPSQSYIGLIAMGILSSKEKKLVLSDIYQWILDNYPYFRTRGPGWRNSIRHNLSLNDCFIKSGRAANGKGHYWAIHPAVVSDFEKGDFRRRRAQRKVRKAMGLAVPDEDDESSSPPPPCSSDIVEWRARMAEASTRDSTTSPGASTGLSPEKNSPINAQVNLDKPKIETSSQKLSDVPTMQALKFPGNDQLPFRPFPAFPLNGLTPIQWKHLQQSSIFPIPRMGLLPGPLGHHSLPSENISPPVSKKRAFDVESLLAPESKRLKSEDNDLEKNDDAWVRSVSVSETDEQLDFKIHCDSDIEVDDTDPQGHTPKKTPL